MSEPISQFNNHISPDRNKDYINKYVISIAVKYRKEANIKQSTMAEILGVTRTSYLNIESGRQRLSPDKIYILACIFNKSIESFFPPVIEIAITTKKTVIKIVKLKHTITAKKIEILEGGKTAREVNPFGEEPDKLAWLANKFVTTIKWDKWQEAESKLRTFEIEEIVQDYARIL